MTRSTGKAGENFPVFSLSSGRCRERDTTARGAARYVDQRGVT
jgi:hypothetical protein